MSQAEAVAGRVGTLPILRRLRGAVANVRLTVIVCVVLICGSFAAAAVIQMHQDRQRALSQAAQFSRRRAEEMAADLGASLDRYEAIGAAFASATTNAETSAALAQAGGSILRNVAVVDRAGRLLSEMMGTPADLLPLSPSALTDALRGRTVLPARDGRSLVLLFGLDRRIVLVQIDPALLLASAGTNDGLLATPAGRLLARGTNWGEAPAAAALALGGAGPVSWLVGTGRGERLISLKRLAGWPLTTGVGLPVADVLGAWYGALPLYLFFILGPAVAGAALAVLFVQVFERHARAAAAVKALQSTRPSEARLLVRLADAERRAAEAERAKSRFVAQVSHELRTPLNAIIGFAEIIEGGVFGAVGHPKYGEYSRDIGIAARELHTKIGSVLEFAALEDTGEAPQTGERVGACDAADVVRAQIQQRAATARARQLKLVVSLPDAAPVLADAHVLGRIVAHLLDNALAYTPKGGTVRVEVRSGARETIVSVRDTGAGFTRYERERAGRPFERFARPDAPGGMGVGLAIAMGLTRGLGATLSLSSLPGDGTLAELRLSAVA